MDRGALQSVLHGVTKSQTRLSEYVRMHTHTSVSFRKLAAGSFKAAPLIDFDFSPGCLFQPATGQTPLQSWSGGRSCSCGAPGFPCWLALAFNPIPVRTEAKGALRENWRALARRHRGLPGGTDTILWGGSIWDRMPQQGKCQTHFLLQEIFNPDKVEGTKPRSKMKTGEKMQFFLPIYPRWVPASLGLPRGRGHSSPVFTRLQGHKD